MKKLFLFLFCTLVPAWAWAQSIEKIKNDPSYYWAEGTGDTMEDADADAMQQLVSQITVWVQHEMDIEVKEAGGNYQQKVKDHTNAVSAAQLTGAKSIPISPEGPARMFRYISHKAVEDMMKQRRERIVSLVKTGKKAEERLQIDDALRNYYWALVLAGNVPKEPEIDFYGDKGQASTVLPTKIKAVLSSLAGRVTNVTPDGSTKRADVFFTYAGKPVATLQYKFFDGQNYVGPVSARDGQSQVDLQPSVTDKLKITYELRFKQEAENLDPELRLAFSKRKLPVITGVSAELDMKEVKTNASERQQQEQQEAAIAASKSASEASGVRPEQSREKKQMEKETVPNPADYEAAMSRIEKAISAANPALAKDDFTPDAYKLFDTLIHTTGKLSLTGAQQYEYVKADYLVLARFMKIRMKFRNGKSFMENLVFRFNTQKKVESFAMALTQKAEADIFSASLSWPEVSRYGILRFMEDYQTAYALRRIDYLDAIFSEHALIITGTVLKPGKGTAPELSDGKNLKISPDQNISYTRLTKSEFLKRLRSQFKSREYIHLSFEENRSEVLNTNGAIAHGYAFGIQLKQIYTSPSYSDVGRLSLMLNMRNPDQPMIEVRLWQPMEATPAVLGDFLSQENMGW